MAVGVWLSDSIDSVPTFSRTGFFTSETPQGEVVRDGAPMLESLKEM